MDLMKLRFVLAVAALFAIVAFSAGVLFYGRDLTQIQVALLTLLASALIAEAKASSSWAFDGVPDKPAAPPVPPTA
jgi:hypothetical protein